MGTIVGFTLLGGGIGACIAIALYALGFGVEILNCACQIITCNCEGEDAIPGMWKDGSFTSMLIFCIIGGLIVGFVLGVAMAKKDYDNELAKRNAKNAEEELSQKILWANDAKGKVLEVVKNCENNFETVEPLVSTEYMAEIKMDNIMKELASISELKKTVDKIADDVKKGGTSR